MNYSTSDMEDVGNSLARTVNYLKKNDKKTIFYIIGTTIFINSILYYKIITSFF